MTKDKFDAMLGTKELRTEALRRVQEYIMATMGICADAINRSADIRYHQGMMDGLASILGLLDTLGKQIESEAFEQGYQLGQEERRGHSYDR